MTTFVIGNVKTVRDEAGMARYRADVLPTVQAYGGNFAIRGARVEVMEGDWHPGHLSILEFPSLAAARQWYHSPEYQAVCVHRRDADLDLLIVDGPGGHERGGGQWPLPSTCRPWP